MKKCPECQKKLGKQDEAFCTACGHQLVATDDIPTLEVAPSIKTRTAKQSFEDENKQLKVQIKKLKETSAILFGTTEEEVNQRAERILTVSGYKRDFSGRVERGFLDHDDRLKINKITVPGWVNKFHFYKRSPPLDIDQDEVLYVATYDSAVDLQRELADIRQLLAECSAQNVSCSFVIATNEDLIEHKPILNRHFMEIKTALPTKKRRWYKLEIWDQKQLLKLERQLKIRVNPQIKTKRQTL